MKWLWNIFGKKEVKQEPPPPPEPLPLDLEQLKGLDEEPRGWLKEVFTEMEQVPQEDKLALIAKAERIIREESLESLIALVKS